MLWTRDDPEDDEALPTFQGLLVRLGEKIVGRLNVELAAANQLGGESIPMEAYQRTMLDVETTLKDLLAFLPAEDTNELSIANDIDKSRGTLATSERESIRNRFFAFQQELLQLRYHRKSLALKNKLLKGRLARRTEVLTYIKKTLYKEVLALREELLKLAGRGNEDPDVGLFSLFDFLNVVEEVDFDNADAKQNVKRLDAIIRLWEEETERRRRQEADEESEIDTFKTKCDSLQMQLKNLAQRFTGEVEKARAQKRSMEMALTTLEMDLSSKKTDLMNSGKQLSDAKQKLENAVLQQTRAEGILELERLKQAEDSALLRTTVAEMSAKLDVERKRVQAVTEESRKKLEDALAHRGMQSVPIEEYELVERELLISRDQKDRVQSRAERAERRLGETVEHITMACDMLVDNSITLPAVLQGYSSEAAVTAQVNRQAEQDEALKSMKTAQSQQKQLSETIDTFVIDIARQIKIPPENKTFAKHRTVFGDKRILLEEFTGIVQENITGYKNEINKLKHALQNAFSQKGGRRGGKHDVDSDDESDVSGKPEEWLAPGRSASLRGAQDMPDMSTPVSSDLPTVGDQATEASTPVGESSFFEDSGGDEEEEEEEEEEESTKSPTTAANPRPAKSKGGKRKKGGTAGGKVKRSGARKRDVLPSVPDQTPKEEASLPMPERHADGETKRVRRTSRPERSVHSVNDSLLGTPEVVDLLSSVDAAGQTSLSASANTGPPAAEEVTKPATADATTITHIIGDVAGLPSMANMGTDPEQVVYESKEVETSPKEVSDVEVQTSEPDPNVQLVIQLREPDPLPSTGSFVEKWTRRWWEENVVCYSCGESLVPEQLTMAALDVTATQTAEEFGGENTSLGLSAVEPVSPASGALVQTPSGAEDRALVPITVAIDTQTLPEPRPVLRTQEVQTDDIQRHSVRSRSASHRGGSAGVNRAFSHVNDDQGNGATMAPDPDEATFGFLSGGAEESVGAGRTTGSAAIRRHSGGGNLRKASASSRRHSTAIDNNSAFGAHGQGAPVGMLAGISTLDTTTTNVPLPQLGVGTSSTFEGAKASTTATTTATASRKIYRPGSSLKHGSTSAQQGRPRSALRPLVHPGDSAMSRIVDSTETVLDGSLSQGDPSSGPPKAPPHRRMLSAGVKRFVADEFQKKFGAPLSDLKHGSRRGDR